eukprot:jgi/Ulvmu1/10056/UM006_0003.1
MSSIPQATDLLESIDWSATECLNASSKRPLDNALKQGYRDDDKLLLESDADEQLLLHINFTASAKLRSIVIAAPNDEHAPKHVKIFINRATIGFSEAEEEGALQSFELTEEHLSGKPVPLKLALFQAVNTLSVFIGSNQGDAEVTKISRVVIAGTTVQGMNVNEIKKSEED